MEWVETTAKSVSEARSRALDLLGIAAEDAEVEVVDEGKVGLFGRVKSEARVRARVRPKAQVTEERSRRRDTGRGKGRGNDRNRGGQKSGGQRSGGRDGGGDRNRNSGGRDGGNRDGGGRSGGRDSGGRDGNRDSGARDSGGRSGGRDSGGRDSGGRSRARDSGGGRDSGGRDSGGRSGGRDGGRDSGGRDSGGRSGGRDGGRDQTRGRSAAAAGVAGAGVAGGAAASRGGSKQESSADSRDSGRDAGRGDSGGNDDRGNNRGDNRRGGRDGSAGPGRSREKDSQVEDEYPAQEQQDLVVDFVGGLAEIFQSDATVEASDDGDTIRANALGDNLGLMIGPSGATLSAIEELTRTTMQRAAGGRRYRRVRVDIDGYRDRRQEALAAFATKIAEDVRDNGGRKNLEPMNSMDRKVVHDTVGDIDGVTTLSEGNDPRRFVVIVAD